MNRAKLKKEQKTEEDVIPSRHNLSIIFSRARIEGRAKKRGKR
jgi:hypothetical protein